MTRIESELHDLYECLMRNDDMADRDTYHTIVGIANDVAEVEVDNAKLRELCEGMLVCYEPCNEHLDARTDCPLYDENEPLRCRKARLLRELRIGVKE